MFTIEQNLLKCSAMKDKLDGSRTREDRRTVKTKQYLADALKQLILEKDYDNITIQDIIDRANVGRSTFYAHYENKEQLLVGNINFQEKLIHIAASEEAPMGINVSYLFEHTKEHLPLFKAMAGSRGREVLGNYFMELCSRKITAYRKRQSSYKHQPIQRYMAEAAAGGIVRMLFLWLEDGARVPAGEMAAGARKILHDLVPEK
jgi:AcrR family transcriptional regulator